MDDKIKQLSVCFALKNKETWLLIVVTSLLTVIATLFLAANSGLKEVLPFGAALQRHGRVERTDQLDSSGQGCRERTNFVFVKVHKCGSHTTTCILQRFGYERDLTFMLPSEDGPDIGYPGFIHQGDYLPSPGGVFNIIADHVRYKKDVVSQLMPQDTAYFAILRHPLGHLKSVFNWRKLAKAWRIRAENPVGRFLETPWYYRKMHSGFVMYTKNLMSFDMGLNLSYINRNNRPMLIVPFPEQQCRQPLGTVHFENETKTESRPELSPRATNILQQYIRTIDRDFVLVMILEYYDESLVMLKRLMCWGIRDILYDLDVRNNEAYRYKHMGFTETQKLNHRQWSAADYAFFEHFNSTLWNKISSQGPDFYEELDYFKFVNKDVNWYCSMKLETTWMIPKSRWNEAFVLNRTFCGWLTLKRWHWDSILKERHIRKWWHG